MFDKYMLRLVEAVTSGEFSEEVVKAKKEYFSKAGEVIEHDKSFENRMICFTEWYCLDRILEKYQKTPLEHFIEKEQAFLNEEEKEVFKGFLKNVHSVFYTVKAKKNEIIVEDMCGSKKFSIPQNGSNLIFLKGEVFEGRLLPFKEKKYFSGSVCFHPLKLYRKIKKALKKKSGNKKEKLEFIWLISSMSLKLERLKQVDYKKIYKF